MENSGNNYSEENTSTEDLEKALLVAAADACWTNDAIDTNCTTNSLDAVEKNSVISNETPSVPSTKTAKSECSVKEVSPSRKLKRCEYNEESSCSSNKKRKYEDSLPPKNSKLPDESLPEGEGYAKVVASHYNQLKEKGLQERNQSRIVYMRNFHNWIKSMLINEYLNKVKALKKYNAPLKALDMGCGKGGDLLKWKKGNISHLICSDIALVSLDQCKARYTDMKNKSSRERNYGNLFSIEYISADCSRVRLREKYSDPSAKLDIVSCQFAFHYSFESLPQAECMLRNASECLQAGGYFIGTIPDANELVSRARKSDTNSFGNDVFQVIFDCNLTKPPLFGAKYNFYLDGVVDCPEFLVHFPTFVKLAKKYGLKLIAKEKFYDFFNRMKTDGGRLLSNMSSLETYPPFERSNLVGTSQDDYKHADNFLEQQRNNLKIGTLSKSEWEASSIYLTFAFQKVKHTWNADGTPCYDI